jgi:hypothetical protein
MSCYTRHLHDLLEEAGMDINPGNKKRLDSAIREVLDLQAEDCPVVWDQVKPRRDDQEFRRLVVGKLYEEG